MTYLSIVLSFSMAGAILAAIRVRKERRLVRDPACWSHELTRTKLIRYTRAYLQNSGWTVLPPWEWINIWVRAVKDGIPLHIVIHDPSISTIRSVTSDVVQENHKSNLVIGILTFEKVEESLLQDAARGFVFYIAPSELIDVFAINKAVTDRVAETRAERSRQLNQRALEEDVSRSSSSDEVALSEPKDLPLSITGLVESVGINQVWGWAFVPGAPTEHVSVELKDGARILGSALARRFRKDLEQSGIGAGDHAFVIESDDAAIDLRTLPALAVVAVRSCGARSAIKIRPQHFPEQGTAAGGGSTQPPKITAL